MTFYPHFDNQNKPTTMNRITLFINAFIFLVLTTCSKLNVVPDVKTTYELLIISGNNQLNAVSSSELDPFVVQVNDSASKKPAANIQITFTVIEGPGNFQGNKSITVPTGANGQVSVKLTMGPKLFELNKIEAKIANSRASATFTSTANRFKDPRDEQIYPALQLLDGKIWMTRNLNYNSSQADYCYADLSSNCDTYGKLYSGMISLSICPAGWHLPSIDEWENLAKAYGGWSMAYKPWIKNGSSGLDLLLGGQRTDKYQELGTSGYYWTSSLDPPAQSVVLLFTNTTSWDDRPRNLAYSCRCVQN